MKLKKIKLNNSKKAILLPETLKLIIGVLCIVLLLYLAVKLYDIFSKKSDLEQARAHLLNMAGKITEIKNQPTGGSFSYILYNPAGWALVGWPYKGYDVPYCKDSGWKSCLCLCPWPSSINTPNAFVESCNLNKVCFDTNVSILNVNPDSYVFGLITTDKSPIQINQLGKDFKGNLNIVYVKSTDTLEIKPIPNK